MTKKATALHSVYVIDGVPQEFTPAQLLDAVTDGSAASGNFSAVEETVVDETVDPVLGEIDLDLSRKDEYASLCKSRKKTFHPAFADHFARQKVASALLDALWRQGHFRLEDLCLDASWTWDCIPVGMSAAFYQTVESVANSVDELGLKLKAYHYADEGLGCDMELECAIAGDVDEDGEPPVLLPGRACPETFAPDPQSWVVYVPFDSCDFSLGGSLLSQVLGCQGCDSTPRIADADYFVDCYEIVRELVEDGVVIAGTTVGDGGLLCALERMCSSGTGVTADICDILSAYQEKEAMRVLFGEIPGAVIQIRDIDFDYLDAEFLLQDVAFFPLGHPVPGDSGIDVRSSAKSGIQTILESLMQKAEGED